MAKWLTLFGPESNDREHNSDYSEYDIEYDRESEDGNGFGPNTLFTDYTYLDDVLPDAIGWVLGEAGSRTKGLKIHDYSFGVNSIDRWTEVAEMMLEAYTEKAQGGAKKLDAIDRKQVGSLVDDSHDEEDDSECDWEAEDETWGE